MANVNRRVLPGFSLTLGYTLFYLSLLVADARRGVLPARRRRCRASEFSGGVWTERARAAYALTFGAAFVAAVGQRRSSACSSPGCSCATTFPGRRLVDSLVDLPLALPTAVAGLVYATSTCESGWLGQFLVPLGIEARVHAARHRPGADLHRPAVRRAHRAAGARGPRRGDRGGGAPPGRDALADVPPRDPADALSGADHRLRAGASRAASASTARSSSSPATCRTRRRSRRS